MHTREEKLQAFGRILDVLDELREKCPWDRKQTNESLRPQTIEEVYELSDAILKGEERELSKELGDVLLHVIFYAKIGEEKRHFDIVGLVNQICDELKGLYLKNGQQIAIDGNNGYIYTAPDKIILARIYAKINEQKQLAQKLSELKSLPTETLDKQKIGLYINVGLSFDLDYINSTNCDGVGLY